MELLRPTPIIYLAATVVNLLGLLLPLALLQVYDRIIPNAANATLGAMISILVVAVFIEALLRIARLQVEHFNAAKFSHNVTVDAFGKMLNPYVGDAIEYSAREMIDRLEAMTRLGSFLGGPARQIAIDLPFSAIFFLMIGMIGGWLVAIPIAVAAVFVVLTYFHGRLLEKTAERKDAHDTRVFDFITEVLGGISTVKCLSTEQMMMRRFEALEKTSATITFHQIVGSDRAQIMAGSLGNITTIAIATAGATMAVDGSITIGTLAACSLLAGRAVQPTLRVAGIWNEYQRTKLTLRETSKILALPALDRRETRDHYPQAPEVRLTDVDCGTGPGRPAFCKVNLSIAPNEVVNVVGPTGIGKSTLLHLIAGLRQPESGRVTIDGMDARNFRSGYANSIGYVSAQTEVFQGTILDNLLVFGAGKGQDRALQICETLGLEDEIFRLPDGYATILGRAAAEALPRGFIQRLVLARALAQQPRLLVLDEAEGFLDASSDRRLREGLEDLRFSSTIVVVSSRPEHVALANRIIDVSQDGDVLLVSERPAKALCPR
ncbi:MAG: ATP-binding cassette domain-containing protein [Pseudomonadota bacterium]